jgi:hypothetical protein
MRMSRPGLWQKRRVLALLVLVSSFVGVLLVEGGLRLVGYEPLQVTLSAGPDFYRERPAPLEYGMSPGFRGSYAGVSLETNDLGFRGPLPGGWADSRRVAILGDSIAFGLFVPLEATFSRVLEGLLPHTAVMNLGVPGYDPIQEVASLREIAALPPPNVVVLVYTLNDAEVASPQLDLFFRLRLYRQTGVRYSRVLQWVVATRHRRELQGYHRWMNSPGVFRKKYQTRIDPIGADESELRGLMKEVEKGGFEWPVSWYGDEDRVGRVRNAFRELHSLAVTLGFKVLVVVVPLLDDDQGRYAFGAAHRVVASEARRAEFGVVDLTESFLAAGMERLRAREGDNVHPNALANRLMADAVREALAAP